MSNARVPLLLTVFVVLVGALAYDFAVARPAVEAAYGSVMKMVEKRTTSKRGEDKIGPAEVQKELGRQPTSTTQEGLTKIETYQWRAGMPLRTYKLYVLYHGIKEPLLANVLKNEEPTKQDIASVESVDPDKAERLKSGPVMHGADDASPNSSPNSSPTRQDGGGSKEGNPDDSTKEPADKSSSEEPSADEPPTGLQSGDSNPGSRS